MDRKPWDVHKSLTSNRLCHIANLIKNVRHQTLELYNPAEGDGPWSLGCRIYERTINIIEHESKIYPWLKIIRKGLYFVLLIDGVPIRFYKDDTGSFYNKLLRIHPAELEAQQEVFYYDNSEWFWRIAVVTDITGEVIRIVTGQFTEQGNLKNKWDIPITDTVSTLTDISPTYRESVVLNKPSVSIRKDGKEEIASNE